VGFAGSVHAGLTCIGCHMDVAGMEGYHDTPLGRVDCAACHSEIGEEYDVSTHGRLLEEGDPDAPTCADCHGHHEIVRPASQASPLFPKNIPTLCGRCHREGEAARTYHEGTGLRIGAAYAQSVHGRGLLRSGLLTSATCTSCHTAHSVFPRSDARSTIHPDRVVDTCGRCHHGIDEIYDASVHGRRGHASDARPGCTDCHDSHTIRRTDAEGFRSDVIQHCGHCHEAVVAAYFDTYHGKVSQLGYGGTARCHDCHGAHDMLPASEPRSRLSSENVVQTCRQCHPGASRRFTQYETHANHHDAERYPLFFWTYWAMIGLLGGVFVVGGAHTMLWLPRALERRRELQAAAEQKALPVPGTFEIVGKEVAGADQVSADHGTETRGGEHAVEAIKTRPLQYQRFTRLERTLHMLLIVSFFGLALTGLTLKFSHTAWAALVSGFLGGFESAGFIHRAAAVVLVGLFATHLWDLNRKRRTLYGGSLRKMITGPDTMIFNRHDLREAAASVRWFLGRGPRPRYGRWTYWEKFDYFAVFWGIFIIGSTGLMLWFPVFFTRFLPGWLINVATIIHSDEALLATGFIFTVHFFNTHVRPEKYPMDLVVFTGRMPLAELKRDKPAEYEELMASGKLEDNLVWPYQQVVLRTFRFFAWAALAVGTLMILWIISATVFA
jgi:cytochrome b subunit of formate dehydrogenase